MGLMLWKELKCGQRAGDGTRGVDGAGGSVIRERRGVFPPKKKSPEKWEAILNQERASQDCSGSTAEGGLAQLGLENAQEAARVDWWGQTLDEGSSAGLGHEVVDRLRSLINSPGGR